MSAVDDLFGSDDEGPGPAPAVAGGDVKARLAALAAAKKREREEEAAAKKDRKPNKKQRADAAADAAAAGDGGGEPRKKKKAKKAKDKGAAAGKKAKRGGGSADEEEEELGTAALFGDFGDDEDEDDAEDWAAEAEDLADLEDGAAGAAAPAAGPRGAAQRQAERVERRGGGGADAADAAGPAEEVEDDDERLRVATEEDRAFIDDEGLAPGERIDWGEDEDEEQLQQIEQAAEAAEEDDEIETMFNKMKKRRRDPDDIMTAAEAKSLVDSVLSAMEVAVESDIRANENGKPAVHKLRVLRSVEEAVTTKRLHSDLMDAGVLGALKAFLDLLPDGSPPNVRVRETVLRLLHQLPVDCSLEDRKEQLKKSGLGRMVMFYYKLPEETAANRRAAKELIERWSRPILAPGRARDLDEAERERILAARAQRQAKAAAAAAVEALAGGEAEEEEGARRQPRFGEAGFRFHAAIPQAAALDYVKAPSLQYALPERKKAGKGGRDEHRLTKKLAGLAKGRQAGRAAVASVEGRNVTVQHD